MKTQRIVSSLLLEAMEWMFQVPAQSSLLQVSDRNILKQYIWKTNYSADIYKILSCKVDPNSGICLSTGLSVTRVGVTRERACNRRDHAWAHNKNYKVNIFHSR